MHETDVPTECAEARQNPRFSQADVDQGRSRGDQGSPGERTPATVGVITGALTAKAGGIGRMRARATFEAIRRSGGRGRSGPLTVTYLEQSSWLRPQVAFAISRRVGNAVVRNRLRRRLRAIVSEQAPTLRIGAYLVSAGPGGPLLGFDELKVAMGQALEKATSRDTAPVSAAGPSGARTGR